MMFSTDEINNIITQKKQTLKLTEDVQNTLKKQIIQNMQNLSDSSIQSSDLASYFVDLLDVLKKSLEICNTNFSNLKILSSLLNDFFVAVNNNSPKIDDLLKNYIIQETSINLEISQNTVLIQDCLENINLNNSEDEHISSESQIPKEESNVDNYKYENEIISPPEIPNVIEESKIEEQSKAEEQTNEEKPTFSKPEDEMPKITEIEEEQIKPQENTLIISETSKKVTLPFTYNDLQSTLDKNQSKYSSIDDIIEDMYTIPISIYKNPFTARFREAYKLMRKREKASIIEAINLGTELMFNYKLHPAIISACKNLDELDIYLDYLENDEVHKFTLFKVIFEFSPTIRRKKHDLDF